MQKTLEIYLREQRELIAQGIENWCSLYCECSNGADKCGCTCYKLAEVARNVEVDVNIHAYGEQEWTQPRSFSNVIELPTRRQSDTRE
jgi:hypothetical protein